MTHLIKAEDVLRDIEFELIQGAIRQDELGDGIQTVRKFHNELRTELLAAVGNSADGREIVTRQTQFNDMVMTLLQEMGNELLQLRQQQRSLNDWTQRHGPPSTAQAAQAEPSVDETPEPTEDWSLPPIERPRPETLPTLTSVVPLASEAEVRAAMRRDALAVPLDVRPVQIPVIGWFLYKIRSALHSLAYFYAQRLAERQTEINRLYGEQLLALMHAQAEIRQELNERQTESSSSH